MITPSHNPPEDGGFKYNPPNGGPADSAVTTWIQDRANALLQAAQPGRAARRPRGRAAGADDACARFRRAVRRAISPTSSTWRRFAPPGSRLAVDPLGGAGVGYWEPINRRVRSRHRDREQGGGSDVRVHDGRSRRQDPHGLLEPLRHGPAGRSRRTATASRSRTIPTPTGTGSSRLSAGLLNPNHYLAVAIRYLLTHRPQWPGAAAIGKTLVSSGMIDRVVASLGRRAVRSARRLQVVRGGPPRRLVLLRRRGERRGELPLPRRQRVDHRQGRHSIMNLLAAEMTARTGRDPGEHYRDLAAEFGSPVYTRIDAPATPEQKARLAKLSPAAVTAPLLAGEPITARLTRAPGNDAAIGGLKVVAASGWFAARPSGTENLYKLYAESFRDERHLQLIVDEARADRRRLALAAPAGSVQCTRVRRPKVCQPPRSHCILRIAVPARCAADGETPTRRGAPMQMTRQLHDLGQSLWLDNITRDLLTTGTLRRYIAEYVGDRDSRRIRRSSIRPSRPAPRTMRRSARSSRRASPAKRSSSSWRRRTSGRRPTCSFRSSSARTASTAGYRSRSRRSSRTTRRPRSPRRASSMRRPGGATSSSRSRERRKDCPRSRRRSSPACRST